MSAIISVTGLSKIYASGFQALKNINLEIRSGEIFALLGPNGAGKTTLISTICGIVKASAGSVKVDGHDIVSDWRAARALIGLVPQELTTDAFETVWATVSFSRGLFGLAAKPAHIEKVLKELSLWEKKDNMIRTLSGGMKRRVLIAKALSHEPRILFLDEPTAGVDVELRRGMWALVRTLRCRRTASLALPKRPGLPCRLPTSSVPVIVHSAGSASPFFQALPRTMPEPSAATSTRVLRWYHVSGAHLKGTATLMRSWLELTSNCWELPFRMMA